MCEGADPVFRRPGIAFLLGERRGWDGVTIPSTPEIGVRALLREGRTREARGGGKAREQSATREARGSGVALVIGAELVNRISPLR